MRKITIEELEEIVNKNYKCLRGQEGGERGVLKDVDLSEMNLSNMDLSCMVFDGSDFRSTVLHNTNFCATSLVKTNFGGASVCNTNFNNAYMPDACVKGTLIQGSNFAHADMRGVRLGEAKIEYSNCFAGVGGIPIYQATKLGRISRTLTLLAEGENQADWSWYVGCSTYDEKALRAAVKLKYGSDCDYLDAIRYLKKVAKRSSYKFWKDNEN